MLIQKPWILGIKPYYWIVPPVFSIYPVYFYTKFVIERERYIGDLIVNLR